MAQGSNELNAILQAKVVKIKVELDYKNSGLHKQVDEITKFLKDKNVDLKVELLNTGLLSEVNKLSKYLSEKKKNVKVGVELDTSATKINTQLRTVMSNLKKEKSLEPIKVNVDIDVKGSAEALKKQIKEVNDIIQDFNSKYRSQLTEMENQQKKAQRLTTASALNVPDTGNVLNYNNIKKYTKTLKEAERIMKTKLGKGEDGLFSSFQMKDAQGNLNGFIATLEKTNGVVEKVRYAWNKDKDRFDIVDRTTADKTEKTVHRSMEALQKLQRELRKTGKASDELEKEYNELMNAGGNNSLNMEMVKAFREKVTLAKDSLQITKEETNEYVKRQKLIRDINKSMKADWDEFKDVDRKKQYKGLLSNVESGDGDLKRQALELQKINDISQENLKTDKELLDNTKKRMQVARELRGLEKKAVSSDFDSQQLISEIKLLNQRTNTTKEYIEITKKMDKLRTSIDNDVQIQKSLDAQEKLQRKLKDLKEVGVLTANELDDALKEIPKTARRSFADLQRELDEATRKLNEITDKNKRIASQSIVKVEGNTPSSSKLKDIVSSGDTAQLNEYIGKLYKGKVETVDIKDATDKFGRAVTEMKVKMAGAGKQIETYTLQLDQADGALRQTAQGIGYNANRNLGIFQQLEVAMKRVPVWMTAMTAFYGTIRSVQAMSREILEVDKSLTELRRVANSDINIDTLFAGSIEVADKLGNSVHDVMDSVNDMARTFGEFNERQLMDIAETATLMANVSDLSAQEATNSLVGTMNAFNMTAQETIHIADAMNEVDNNFAISTQQLAQGMAKSASTAEAYGMTLEENIGAITAIGGVTMESGNIIGKQVAV